MPGRTRTHNGKTYALTAAHPLADLLPWMSDTEIQELADDIAANGQRQPVIRCRGVIVDGRHRELSSLIAGVKPKYSDLDSGTPEAKIRAGIISANLRRRHLTASQRAAVAAELETLGHGGNRTGPGQDATLHLEPGESGTGPGQDAILHLETRADLAAQLGVSPRTVAAAAKVKDEAPELFDLVKDGTLPAHAAARLAEYPQEVREAVASAPDPKAAADELLSEMFDDPEPSDGPPGPPAGLAPLNGALPVPRIDAGAKKPHPLYGDRKRPARKLDEHRYGKILVAMRDLSRMLTVAMNAPDGGRLKDYLRFLGLVQDRGFILNGRKYNARFRGFQFRHAVKIAVGKGRVLTKAELLKACLADWESDDDLGEAVPE